MSGTGAIGGEARQKNHNRGLRFPMVRPNCKTHTSGTGILNSEAQREIHISGPGTINYEAE